jgi:dethiobiotin synthetase
MTQRLVVAGTDTNIGKTVLSAALVSAVDGYYWKPVQSGLDGPTDADVVRELSRLPQGRILPEAYRLKMPASPHLAAEREGVEIDVENLRLPETDRALVVELAGGLMVPLTRRLLQIDVIAQWGVPVVLCASTRLGMINHSLLSIEALQRRAVPLAGIAFIGEELADSERTIVEMSGVRLLGRLPHVDPLNAETLRAAFDQHFDLDAFPPGAVA